MNPALLFLVRRSAANALRSKIRRLRSPRYLVPTLLGAAYFFLVFDPFGILVREGKFRAPPDPAASQIMEWGITGGILLMASLSWILPVRGVPLAFLEAEVAQLFPAPVTRRELVRYKILDLQKYLVFLPVIFGLLNLSRFGPLRAAFIGLGSWLAFNALTLHGIGAKMTRMSLAEHGWSGWKRNLLPVGVVAAFIAFVALNIPALPRFPEGSHGKEILAEWLGRLGDSPAGWALHPFRLLVRPFFAEDLGGFALRTGGLAALVVLLYLWVMRTDVAFEEAAAAQAETLARRIEAAKKGKFTTGEPGKPVRKNPLPLSPSGPPEAAFVWKSVAEFLRGLSPRLLIFAFVAFAITVPIGLDAARGQGEWGQKVLALSGAGMAMLAGMLVFVGPSMVGVSLRQDLERVEVLKTFPLSGGRLVRCSLAGTLVPIAAMQALLVLLAVILFPSLPKLDVPPAWRLAALVLGATALPAITAISAAVDAALVLYFPGWVKPGQPVAQGGMEGMGYGILSALVKVLALALGLIIPGICAAVLGFLGGLLGPEFVPAAVAAAGVLGAVVVAAEVWLLSEILGRRFEAFDPAEEGLVA